MVQLFKEDVSKSNLMPIGEMVDLFYRVEFQQRVACEQAHLIGKGGGSAIASRRFFEFPAFADERSDPIG